MQVKCQEQASAEATILCRLHLEIAMYGQNLSKDYQESCYVESAEHVLVPAGGSVHYTRAHGSAELLIAYLAYVNNLLKALLRFRFRAKACTCACKQNAKTLVHSMLWWTLKNPDGQI